MDLDRLLTLTSLRLVERKRPDSNSDFQTLRVAEGDCEQRILRIETGTLRVHCVILLTKFVIVIFVYNFYGVTDLYCLDLLSRKTGRRVFGETLVTSLTD
jgi:hypothetical protein